MQSNVALKKEVADLRFRIVMAGSDAPADARTEWGALKDDLVRQLQAAETSVAELQGRLNERVADGAGAKDRTTRVDATAELKRVQRELEDSRAAAGKLEGEVARLQVELDTLRAGAQCHLACAVKG